MPRLLRLAPILAWLGFASVALGYDYSHCIKYFKAASTPANGSYAISLKNGKNQIHLLFSPTAPKNVQILKADPFIGLYLIESIGGH